MSGRGRGRGAYYKEKYGNKSRRGGGGGGGGGYYGRGGVVFTKFLGQLEVRSVYVQFKAD